MTKGRWVEQGENPVANHRGTPQPIPEARFASNTTWSALGRPPLRKGAEGWGQEGAGCRGGGSRAPPVRARSSERARTVGAQGKASPKGGLAGKVKQKGNAAGEESRPPRRVSASCARARPSRQSAHVQRRSGQSGSLLWPPLPRLSPEKGEMAGKDGVFRGAESPAPE